MRIIFVIAAACFALGGQTAAAQQRDTTAKRDTAARSDSAARADSIAREDSIRIVRELERLQREPRTPTAPPPSPTAGGTGPVNPRLLPDISTVGDIVGDLSPDGTTQEDGTRFGVREIEVAIQAAVDPYFRGDIFLGVNDLERIAIEQAYLTATALPWSMEARIGRFLMPVGKQNTTHRHDLHAVEYPWVIQSFLGGEGLTGTGLWVSKIFAPFGFYQELQATVVDHFGEAPDDLYTTEPVNKKLSGLGYALRLRNYWDLSEASNIELSASAITGKREQPLVCTGGPGGASPCAEVDGRGLGVAARQSVVGVDVTYRWRPLQQGLYRSFILQAEWMRQINEQDPALPDAVTDPEYAGPREDGSGGYVFARYQLTRRLYLGGRVDVLNAPATLDAPGDDLRAQSIYLELFPSEFSKLLAGFEHVRHGARSPLFPDLGPDRDVNRILLQATFALGPHKPHPF